MAEKLLTTRQAAKFLGLKPSCLENWRWKGYGPPYVQVTRRAIRYRREDLDAFVQERRRFSTSDAGLSRTVRPVARTEPLPGSSRRSPSAKSS